MDAFIHWEFMLRPSMVYTGSEMILSTLCSAIDSKTSLFNLMCLHVVCEDNTLSQTHSQTWEENTHTHVTMVTWDNRFVVLGAQLKPLQWAWILTPSNFLSMMNERKGNTSRLSRREHAGRGIPNKLYSITELVKL